MPMNMLEMIALRGMRKDLPAFGPGDTVRVHVKIKEAEKERVQVFEGVCIRRHRGQANATFTVRKVSYGIGVERIFPAHSPIIDKLEIVSRGRVRRARLYYLRSLKGKAARLKETLGVSAAALVAPPAPVAAPAAPVAPKL